MNANDLDNSLRMLTDSEKKYKQGKTFSFDNVLQKKVDGEIEYFLLNPFINEITETNFASQITETDFTNQIAVKKNSRFNPVPFHIHSYVEICYVYSGVCPQNINGINTILKENQVLLLDEDVPHSIGELGENDITISIIVSKQYISNNVYSKFSSDNILSNFFINAINEKAKHDKYILFDTTDNNRIRLFFQELLIECYNPSTNDEDTKKFLFLVIMSELINSYKVEQTKHNYNKTSISIVAILKYIENNYKTCTHDEVAKHFYVSKNHLTKLIKKYTNMTYKELIQDKKLNISATLLRNSTLNITMVANKSGYENISFFYKKFYQKFGLTPNEYRNSRMNSII